MCFFFPQPLIHSEYLGKVLGKYEVEIYIRDSTPPKRDSAWRSVILSVSLDMLKCICHQRHRVDSMQIMVCLLPFQPPRTAHPVVRFSCVDCEPMVIDKLPFDKYELEPSPLTQYILERKSPHACWQVLLNAVTCRTTTEEPQMPPGVFC